MTLERDHLMRYARRVRDLRRAHAAVSEPALAPAFQELVEDLLAISPSGSRITVVPEYDNHRVGRPDIALVQGGAPAEDLEEVFPHVPFPADHATFLRAAQCGSKIRAVQTFARPPAGAFESPVFVRLATTPGGLLDAGEPDSDSVVLCADRSGRVEGLPPAL